MDIFEEINGKNVAEAVKEITEQKEDGSIVLTKTKSDNVETKSLPRLDEVIINDPSGKTLNSYTYSEREQMAREAMAAESGEDAESTYNTARTDTISINGGRKIECAVRCAGNFMASLVDSETQYSSIGLSVTMQNTGEQTTMLSIYDPTYKKDPPELRKKEKLEKDTVGNVNRNMSATNFNASVILPMSDGAFDFNDMQTIESIRCFINSIVEYGRYAVDKEVISKGVPSEEVWKSTLYHSHKSNINASIKANHIDLDPRALRALRTSLNQVIANNLGVHPYSTTNLKIELSMCKITLLPKGSFSTLSQNVTIFPCGKMDMKVERTSFGFSFSLPYFKDANYAKDIVTRLAKLEEAFAIWAEKEARSAYGYDLRSMDDTIVIPKSFSVPNLSSSELLQIPRDRVEEIIKEVNNMIADTITADKINSLGNAANVI